MGLKVGYHQWLDHSIIWYLDIYIYIIQKYIILGVFFILWGIIRDVSFPMSPDEQELPMLPGVGKQWPEGSRVTRNGIIIHVRPVLWTESWAPPWEYLSGTLLNHGLFFVPGDNNSDNNNIIMTIAYFPTRFNVKVKGWLRRISLLSIDGTERAHAERQADGNNKPIWLSAIRKEFFWKLK